MLADFFFFSSFSVPLSLRSTPKPKCPCHCSTVITQRVMTTFSPQIGKKAALPQTFSFSTALASPRPDVSGSAGWRLLIHSMRRHTAFMCTSEALTKPVQRQFMQNTRRDFFSCKIKCVLNPGWCPVWYKYYVGIRYTPVAW